MKKKKQKNLKREKLKEKKKVLQQKIRLYSDQFNLPILDKNNNIIVNTHSWFNITEYHQQFQIFDKNIQFETDELNSDNYFTVKLLLRPNNEQKLVLHKWLDCYIHMYNAVIKYIKMCRFNKQAVVFSITSLKKILSNDKNKIHKWSKLTINNKEIYVDKHLLDYAINDSINRYRTCLSNLRGGYITHFRLRYLKFNKENKIFKMEKLAVKERGFYISSLGKIMMSEKDNFNYVKNWHTMMTVQYQSKNDKFHLLIKYPTSYKQQKDGNEDQKVIMDMGVRKFSASLSNNKFTIIGNNMKKRLEPILKNIDKINKSTILTKTKKLKLVKKKYTKIHNLVEDVHWKVINYLTNNFKTILIGNWSTKESGENGKVSKMTKRLANVYRIYSFKEKLKYKCKYLGIKYKEVDEPYTSKCCCKCGTYKKDLGGNETYDCKICNVKKDRDLNSTIDIAIKGILEK
jgi:putative transposase